MRDKSDDLCPCRATIAKMPLGNEIEIIFRCHFQLSGLWVVPFLFLKLIISFLHFAFRAVPFARLNSFSHPANTSASLQISSYPNNAGAAAAVTVLVFGEDASEKSPSTENKSTKIEIWSEPRLNDGNRSIQFGIPSRAGGWNILVILIFIALLNSTKNR